MLANITIGQYFPGNSLLHRLDPRGKIILTALFITAVFLVGHMVGYLLIGGFVALCVWISKIQPKYILKGLKPILYLLAFTFILNIFFSPGDNVIWEWRFIRLTEQGLTTALFLALRLIFLVIGTSLLTLTTSPITLTDGLERLMNPLKKIGFPSHELAMMMTIALRFIPILIDETDKIMKAQIARGADFESGNLIRRAKAMVPLLVPLFVGAFRRADELAMAMEARCYRGGDRTRMKTLHYSSCDAIALASTLGLMALVLAGNRVF